MRRIGAILFSLIMLIMVAAPIANAADFGVTSTSPKDKETGVPLENMGVKVFFNEEVYSKDNEKENAKKCKIIDSDGNEIETIVLFNPKDKKVALVLAKSKDKKGKAITIKPLSNYKLVIEKGFKSAGGTELSKDHSVTFETVNPSTTMKISMGMMALMVVGMVFASSRAMKKDKEADEKKKTEKVNPYKVAKKTGKSVEDVVAAEKKKKEKEVSKLGAEDEDDYEEVSEIRSRLFKVSQPKNAGDFGSKYVEKVRARNAKNAMIQAKIKAAKKGKGKRKK